MKTIDEMINEVESALTVAYDREQRFYENRSNGAAVKDTQYSEALTTLNELRERHKALREAAKQALVAIGHNGAKDKWEQSGNQNAEALKIILALKSQGKTVGGELQKAFQMLQEVLK